MLRKLTGSSFLGVSQAVFGEVVSGAHGFFYII